MRIATLNDKEMIYINGSVITPFIYHEQFKSDLLVDISKAIHEDTIINQHIAHKILWSLAKTHDRNTLDYDQWIQFVDIQGNGWQKPMLSEIKDNFELRERESYKDVSEEEIEEDKVTYHLGLIANSLRMGIPLELLNEMSLDTLLDFQEVYLGEEEEKPRQATQEDIDAWFG